MNVVNVHVPGTVSNVGSGFDVMGFAMQGAGELMQLSLRTDGQIVLHDESGYNLPLKPETNTAAVALQSLMNAAATDKGFDVVFRSKIKPGSGLGSSAASAVAAVFGANELLGKPFDKMQLIDFAMDGEEVASGSRHADNVAPAMLGSFVLIRAIDPMDIIEIPSPKGLYCAVVHPHIEVKTAEARSILPKEIPLKNAVQQWGNTAALIAGLYQGNFPLIGRAMHDLVAEPVRSRFIPNYAQLKELALQKGAIGYTISGSGPSMFAFCNSLDDANRIARAVQKHLANQQIHADYYTGAIDKEGVRVVPSL